MKIPSHLTIILLLTFAFATSGRSQATSVKRITKQLPPGSVPAQPPSAPAPPAKSVQPPATSPTRTGSSGVSAVPAAPVKARTDAEKSDLLKRTIESEQRRAEAGSASAQYDVGMRYFRGDGVGKNLEEAAKWLEKSAKQGNETAAKRLGDIKGLSKP